MFDLKEVGYRVCELGRAFVRLFEILTLAPNPNEVAYYTEPTGWICSSCDGEITANRRRKGYLYCRQCNVISFIDDAPANCRRASSAEPLIN